MQAAANEGTPGDVADQAATTIEAPLPPHNRLSPEEFCYLAEMPPDAEWLDNIVNAKTAKAYKADLGDFMGFTGLESSAGLRNVSRGHIIAWRKALEARHLSPATIRRRLSALSAFFNHLCEADPAIRNPTRGVRRPKVQRNQGKTPAISDEQARALLEAPPLDTLKGKRDRAILATFLYHGLRREELCRLKVKDIVERGGAWVLLVHGKGDKIRHVPAHPKAVEGIKAYLDAAGHRDDSEGPLFRPVKNPRSGVLNKPLSPAAVHHRIVKRYARQAGLEVLGFCVHSLRATAATNALEHSADMATVQEWLGHSNIATTRLYDRRRMRAEDSPTFRVIY